MARTRTCSIFYLWCFAKTVPFQNTFRSVTAEVKPGFLFPDVV